MDTIGENGTLAQTDHLLGASAMSENTFQKKVTIEEPAYKHRFQNSYLTQVVFINTFIMLILYNIIPELDVLINDKFV